MITHDIYHGIGVGDATHSKFSKVNDLCFEFAFAVKCLSRVLKVYYVNKMSVDFFVLYIGILYIYYT